LTGSPFWCADLLSPGPEGSSPVWVDTVGYDDTTNLSDADSFREVLRYLSDQNLTSVRAIVWTVIPQVGLEHLVCRGLGFQSQEEYDQYLSVQTLNTLNLKS